MDNTKIGAFIKNLRKDKNLTQKELADKLGITDRAISKWERGMGCPDISLLEDLAKVLEVSVLEILKGELLDSNKSLNEKDLLESMSLSKKNILNNIKKITNIVTIVIIVIISLVIAITNIRSISLLNKNYDMYELDEDYNIFLESYQEKVNIILNNQGIYSDDDYARIKSSTKIMFERLDEQNNDIYLSKNKFNYIDIVNFYLEHQNLSTMEIDNIDLYKILLKYDTSVSNHMIRYEYDDLSIDSNYSYIFFFLQQPYYPENTTELNNYLATIYHIHSFISNIYEREIMLLDDIIKIGGLQWIIELF